MRTHTFHILQTDFSTANFIQKLHEQCVVTLKRNLCFLCMMQFLQQLADTPVMSRRGVYFAYKSVSEVKIIVAMTLDYIVYVRRNGYLCQTDFPFTIEFNCTAQFRRESSSCVLWMLVHGAIRRQRQVESAHFATSSSTHESNLLG